MDVTGMSACQAWEGEGMGGGCSTLNRFMRSITDCAPCTLTCCCPAPAAAAATGLVGP
jgi:hypothetical protein